MFQIKWINCRCIAQRICCLCNEKNPMTVIDTTLIQSMPGSSAFLEVRQSVCDMRDLSSGHFSRSEPLEPLA